MVVVAVGIAMCGVGVDEVVVGRSKVSDVATNKQCMCSASGRC